LQKKTFVHIGERKNDILHLQTYKRFFQLTQEKEKNDIAHLKTNKWFFQLAKEKERNDIAHL
jgi:hypothetical protein